ncbi:ATP-binding protein [Martelella alba]|uniref:histidine kinase n=1 Tax=Martelella alba TaxID=2590451 RepID=A0ABY2SKX8_9HYPH|nr:ATP-binding protein [Martelella alba]TKI06103.1 HAMP domain-containing protein [Martelella alba]
MTRPWPRSLLARNSLLLVLLVFITTVSSITVFVLFVEKPRIDGVAQLIAAQISTLDNVLSQVPLAERAKFVAQINGRAVLPQSTTPFPPTHFLRGYEATYFLKRFYSYLPDNTLIRWQATPNRQLWVKVNVAGQPYWITLPSLPAARGIGIISTLLLISGLSLLALIVVYVIHRRVNRPLTLLVQAAQWVGRGRWPAPLAVDGPSETAAVSATFNTMIERLKEYEAHRATILAGISHDIRTPLTKLRLALAMNAAPDDEGDAAGRYLDDIDVILQQFIDFARGSADEPCSRGDINQLITELAQDFAGLGQTFTLKLAPVTPFFYRPIAVMRLLMNLMGNAAKYGQRELEVATWQAGQQLFIAVRDRGPAVSDAELEQLKFPFRRGSHSGHSQNGSGLGLAIAEQIAQQHNGGLTLRRRAGGGFEALAVLDMRAP